MVDPTFLAKTTFIVMDVNKRVGTHIIEEVVLRVDQDHGQSSVGPVSWDIGPVKGQFTFVCVEGTPIWDMTLPVTWLENTEDNRKTVELLYG